MRLIQQKSSDWFNYFIPCISDTFKKAKNSKIDSSAGGAYSVVPDPPAEWPMYTCWVFDAKLLQENV